MSKLSRGICLKKYLFLHNLFQHVRMPSSGEVECLNVRNEKLISWLCILTMVENDKKHSKIIRNTSFIMHRPAYVTHKQKYDEK